MLARPERSGRFGGSMKQAAGGFAVHRLRDEEIFVITVFLDRKAEKAR